MVVLGLVVRGYVLGYIGLRRGVWGLCLGFYGLGLCLRILRF